MKDYLDDVNHWLSNKMISAEDAVKKVIDSKTPYFNSHSFAPGYSWILAFVETRHVLLFLLDV